MRYGLNFFTSSLSHSDNEFSAIVNTVSLPRILYVYIFHLFLYSISRDLTVEMNVRRGLTGALVLLSVLDRSSGSVNVGANLGISGLFQPSTEYHYVRQSYPYYLDEYQYRQLDQNFLEDVEEEDQDLTVMQDFNDLDEIDRQVTGPGILDDGGQIFGDLTPLLFTSALVVGLR